MPAILLADSAQTFFCLLQIPPSLFPIFYRFRPAFFLCLLRDVGLRDCSRRHGQLIQRNHKPNSKPCTSRPCLRSFLQTLPRLFPVFYRFCTAFSLSSTDSAQPFFCACSETWGWENAVAGMASSYSVTLCPTLSPVRAGHACDPSCRLCPDFFLSSADSAQPFSYLLQIPPSIFPVLAQRRGAERLQSQAWPAHTA